MWRDIALYCGMTYKAQQSRPEMLQHVASSL